MSLPAIAQVLLQEVEDAGFLWLVRQHAIIAPNSRLRDIVRLDERVEAHIDALRVAGEAGWIVASDALERTEAGAVFTCCVLAIEAGRSKRFIDIFAGLANADEGYSDNASARLLRDVTGALCWSAQAPALQSIDWLKHGSESHLRAIAIAASGDRRLDPGDTLQPLVLDSSPIVKSYACRASGQLGRADLFSHLTVAFTDPDPECRFWSAWAAARMGAIEPLDTLAEIAWNNFPRSDRALDLLLRRLDVPQANVWLREFARLPDRQRSLIRATGVIGDPLYVPWLIDNMTDSATARLAGEAFSMITGLDLAYRDLDRRPPPDVETGPNDDPADETVALDEDENLPWPDPARIGAWWHANRYRFRTGTPYFLGAPKEKADWLRALSDAFQRQRHAAALELAIRQPNRPMFEVCARGRLQRLWIARAQGAAQ